jgi:hypothetical protein
MTKPPELRVQLTKKTDGTVALRCIRRDGSETWEHHDKSSISTHFAFHDLTHFAVETTLRLHKGFFGLIADGWDIPDTTGKGSRGKLPVASSSVEYIVGLFDGERRGVMGILSSSEFNEQLDAMMGVDPNRSRFTDDQLTRARNRIHELHSQWIGVPAGSALELMFNRD